MTAPTPNDDGFATRAIHVGQEPDPRTGAVVVPIYQTSTFVQDAVGQHRGYEYARTGNPTRTALQECLASLEGAEACVAFASGLSAEDAIFRLCEPGDHVVPSPRKGALESMPETFVHMYGKAPRAGRKIGHVTLNAPSEQELDALLERFTRVIG